MIGLIEWLWQRYTGLPYWTGRSCTEDFGPTIGARYARELSAYSDVDLVLYGDWIVSELSARDARRSRSLAA